MLIIELVLVVSVALAFYLDQDESDQEIDWGPANHIEPVSNHLNEFV